jgi:amino acid adenylation domain-containing protein
MTESKKIMHQPLANSDRSGVSVVIPAYNSSRFLPAAIESVLIQTYPEIEIVVVDDGSTDDTKAVCDRYPTVKYIYQSNQGLSGARNTGIGVSQGAHLIFLDSDDCLLPDAVEIGVNSLNAHPEAGFVFGNYLFQVMNPDGSYTTQKLFDEPPKVASYATILAAQHHIQCAAVMFRRVAIDAVGGFESNLIVMEDLNLYLRVARTFPIYFHDRVVSEYRYHGGNISSQPAKMLMITLNAYSLEWSYFQQTGNLTDLAAYECGRSFAIKFYGDRLPYEMMRCVQANNWVGALGNRRLLLNYDPRLELIDREIYASADLVLRNQLRELPIQSSLAYWQQQLQGGSGLLSLPTDRPRLGQQTFQGKSKACEIDRELSTALNLLSQQQSVTLSTILLAAFKILLYRYTGLEDIIVGTPTVDRIDAEIFVNAVALRTDLAGNPEFQSLLQQVQQVATLAQRHQTVPIELIEDLQLQVTFVFEEDLPFDRIEFASLTAIPWIVEPNTAKFDLTLYLKQTSNGLEGQWIYNSDLFDPATIDRLHGHFYNLLTGIVANPQQSIGALPLLTDPERQQLLVDWNDTQSDYPQDKCIHQLFEEQVSKTPDAVAVVCGEERLTYAQLNLKSNQLAHHLQAVGVSTGSLVGICIERSIDLLVGLLGILKAGCAYVPLDPNYPQERLAYLLDDSQVTVLLTQSQLVNLLPASDAALICLDIDWGVIAQHSQANPQSRVDFSHLAYVIYTSGSTGKPKGVAIRHQGVANYLNWCIRAYAVAAGGGAPVQSSIAFDATITSIFSPLLVGQKVVLVPEKQEIEALVSLLQSCHNFSLVKITPAHLEILKHLLKPAEAQGRTRALIVGGEALLGNNLAFWRDNAPQTRIINEYGPTETVVGCCVYEVTDSTCLAAGIPIGRPIANTQLYVLDRLLQPVPIGVKGELYIGGDGVAQGYWRREELTTERFIPTPFSDDPHVRLYKTGDLARYLPDGNLEYLGRIDDQVKIRGFRIELGEIEAVLSQHPDVEESTVIVREDLPGDKRLAAYIVTQNLQISIDELRAFLSEQVPIYMIPTVFGIVAALPLTVNGKVDRHALLADRVESQIIGRDTALIPTSQLQPDSAPSNLATGSTPRNPTEAILVTIWSEILGQNQIGIDRNFFELGGHSISILQVAAGIQQQLGGIEIPVVKLFQYPTIARLAAYLNGEQNSQQSNLQLKNRAQQQKAANARRRR